MAVIRLTSKLEVFSKGLEAGVCAGWGLILGFNLLKSTVFSKPRSLKPVGEAWLSQASTFLTSLFWEELWGSACPSSSLSCFFPRNLILTNHNPLVTFFLEGKTTSSMESFKGLYSGL